MEIYRSTKEEVIQDLREGVIPLAVISASVFKIMNWTWVKDMNLYTGRMDLHVPDIEHIGEILHRLIDRVEEGDGEDMDAETGRLCVIVRSISEDENDPCWEWQMFLKL